VEVPLCGMEYRDKGLKPPMNCRGGEEINRQRAWVDKPRRTFIPGFILRRIKALASVSDMSDHSIIPGCGYLSRLVATRVPAGLLSSLSWMRRSSDS
jgi:hypothetical protein